LHAAREHRGVRSFDEKVEMVALDRVLDHANVSRECASKDGSDGMEKALLPEIGSAWNASHDDVNGMSLVVGTAREVLHEPDAIASLLSTGRLPVLRTLARTEVEHLLSGPPPSSHGYGIAKIMAFGKHHRLP